MAMAQFGFANHLNTHHVSHILQELGEELNWNILHPLYVTIIMVMVARFCKGNFTKL